MYRLNRDLFSHVRDVTTRRYWTSTLPAPTLVYHLLVTALITGVVDATTYADYRTFTSNQTGNTVLLGIGAVDLIPVDLIDVGVSLSSFLVTTLICGQFAAYFGIGRVRWWTVLSSSWQTLLVLIVPCLAYGGHIVIDVYWSWLVILLLASSAGAQVSQAKQFGIKEIPTAMLTSPFADLLCDPHLFSPHFTKSYNVSRNRRAGYIFSFVLGVFLGGLLHRHQGTAAALLFAGVLKVLVTVSYLFVPREREKTSHDKAEQAEQTPNDKV